jgi:tetratricopeptide (TPR) repeat protein
VLDHYDYPTDRYGGFAVECEWVLHLLITGRAVHVPRPLYQKRIRPDGMNASAQRIIGHSREFIREALDDHRIRMLALLRKTGFTEAMQNKVELAAEAAMLRRYMTLNLGPFLSAQIARAEHILKTTQAAPDSYGKGIRAMALLALSRNAAIEGHRDTALELVLAAIDSDPSLWEGLAHLSRLHLDANRSIEALGTARRAWTVAPNARGLRELITECESEIEQDRHREIMQNGQSAMLAERFDAASYLIDFPDVAAAGVDPWQHYCEFGWREGRPIRLLPVKL